MIQIGAIAMACHRRMEARLETLVRAGVSLVNDPAAALGAIGNACRFLEARGALHTADEEDSLLPRLRHLIYASETAFVNSLEADHRKADSIYAQLI